MATWRYSTMPGRAEAVSSRNAVGRFLDFSHGGGGGRRGIKPDQLMLIRKWQLRPVKRSFSVRNVSSEQQQKVKDLVTQQQGSISFSNFCIQMQILCFYFYLSILFLFLFMYFFACSIGNLCVCDT